MDIPSPGRIVRYQLSAADAEAINKRRADAQACMNMHRAHSTGVQVHVGNPVEAGQVYPLFITRAWGAGGIIGLGHHAVAAPEPRQIACRRS